MGTGGVWMKVNRSARERYGIFNQYGWRREDDWKTKLIWCSFFHLPFSCLPFAEDLDLFLSSKYQSGFYFPLIIHIIHIYLKVGNRIYPARLLKCNTMDLSQLVLLRSGNVFFFFSK